MIIDKDIEKMTNDLSMKIPTIQESIQSFLLSVPENYPNPAIPIRKQLFEECLVGSLLDFLCKNRIGFLDELSSDTLWTWRHEYLSGTIHDPSKIAYYIIAAKEFLKHNQRRLSLQLLRDLDLAPRPVQKGEDEEEDVERNPLYVYLQDLL